MALGWDGGGLQQGTWNNRVQKKVWWESWLRGFAGDWFHIKLELGTVKGMKETRWRNTEPAQGKCSESF